MGTSEFRVMIVMVVVRTLPNAAGAQNQDSKNVHQKPGQAGRRQDRLVLLVVINDKKAENEQSAEDAADNFTGQMGTPKGAGQAGEEKNSSREDRPPTFCS